MWQWFISSIKDFQIARWCGYTNGASRIKSYGQGRAHVTIERRYRKKRTIMLFRLIVRLLGGWWAVRLMADKSGSRIGRRFFGLLNDRYLETFGSWIPLTTKFDGQPCFPHGPYSIFISSGAKFGKNAVIFQGVTVGSNTLIDSKNGGSPQMGGAIYLGAGAKVIGGVSVGDNVRVGANAVIGKDTQSNTTVIANSEHRFSKGKKLDNRYITYSDGKPHFYDDGELKLLN